MEGLIYVTMFYIMPFFVYKSMYMYMERFTFLAETTNINS